MLSEKRRNLFRQRFINRDDTYAFQWKDKKDEGNWKFLRAKDFTTKEHEPITDEVIDRHVAGKKTIGLYALSERDTCKWICIDIDIEKGYEGDESQLVQYVKLTTELLVQQMLDHAEELPMLVENSGRRGYHIWLFCEDLDGTDARAIGTYFAGLVEPPEGISIEVYPKQVAIDSVGSLVKPPFGVHKKTGKRCQFVDADFQPLKDQWKALEDVEPWPNDWWKLFMDEQDIEPMTDLRYERGEYENVGLPCITNMLTSGASKGQRDEAAYILATYFIRHGIPPETTQAALEEWNTRNEVPLSSETIGVKINSAIRGQYSYYPCQKERLDSFCDPNCRFYERKMATRQQHYRK